jgi:hypothetical protein
MPLPNPNKPGDSGESIDSIKYLGETNHACIFLCSEGYYHFHFKNLMLKLNKEDFLYFNKVVNEYVLERNTAKTYLGKEIIIKSSSSGNMNFGFTRREFFELKELFSEAVFMNDVFELTNPKKQNNIIQ